MSLYNGPVRAGSRGGRDQFNWESVKADKDREFFLGHSVKAPTGRWQKGKDILWYTREKNEQGTLQEELQAVKAREKELMLEALGLKPKTQHQPQTLDKNELANLLKRTGPEDGEEENPDRIKGLGFGDQAMASGPAVVARLEGVGLPDEQGGRGVDEIFRDRAPGTAQPAGALQQGKPGAQEHFRKLDEENQEKKRSKKSKKEKKEKKKRKKEDGAKHKKKHKKSKKKTASGSSSSDSDSEPSGEKGKVAAGLQRDIPPAPQFHDHAARGNYEQGYAEGGGRGFEGHMPCRAERREAAHSGQVPTGHKETVRRDTGHYASTSQREGGERKVENYQRHRGELRHDSPPRQLPSRQAGMEGTLSHGDSSRREVNRYEKHNAEPRQTSPSRQFPNRQAGVEGTSSHRDSSRREVGKYEQQQRQTSPSRQFPGGRSKGEVVRSQREGGGHEMRGYNDLGERLRGRLIDDDDEGVRGRERRQRHDTPSPPRKLHKTNH